MIPPGYAQVPVDQIEQPTALGNACYWLRTKGHSSYQENEEVIWDTFQEIQGVNITDVCRQEECRSFIAALEDGETPHLDKEAIQLLRHNDQFWASEGKHRVCAAKRVGVTHIWARVEDIADDLMPLPAVGIPGTFKVVSVVPPRLRLRTGHDLFVYANDGVGVLYPRPARAFLLLDSSYLPMHRDQWTSVISGLDVRKTVRTVRPQWWRRLSVAEETVVEVRVAAEMAPAKVWIAEVPFVEGVPDFSQRRDVFRRGLLRQRDAVMFFGEAVAFDDSGA